MAKDRAGKNYFCTFHMSREIQKDKDKYKCPNPRRAYTLMSPEEAASGKKSHISELEITGAVRNLSPNLWKMTHLTILYLNNNRLITIPPDIARLNKLTHLDISCNQLQSLPPELGDIVTLRELLLNNNCLRSIPFELGRLFQLQNLELEGNPLPLEIIDLFNQSHGTQKLLCYLLDNLAEQLISLLRLEKVQYKKVGSDYVLCFTGFVHHQGDVMHSFPPSV